MTSLERVRRAIEFGGPDRVPIVFWNCDQTRGDVLLYHLALGVPGDGTVNAWDWSMNEWEYRLVKSGDGTMGHPVDPVYRHLPRADDWGTQSGMMISPALWRQLFKPRYAGQFALAHQLGLDTWYHCCGEFLPIMEDYHEIGADVLNIAQPNVNDISEVGRRLRGRQCFLMPISAA